MSRRAPPRHAPVAAVLGVLGACVGLVATWFSGLGEPFSSSLGVAAASCLLALWGGRLAWLRRRRLAPLLLLEAAVGLGIGLGVTSATAGALLLLAAVLARLGR